MKDNQEKWIPVEDIPERSANCFCQFIGWDERTNKNGFVLNSFFVDIVSFNKTQKNTFRFENVQFYSVANELRRNRTFRAIINCSTYSEKSYIFSVKKSNLLRWFYAEDYYIFNERDNPLFHFIILTSEEFIDIITPVFEVNIE